MREIVFTIDEDTGKMEVEINGVQGPACEQYIAMIEELVGAPTTQKKKAEYHVRTNVQRKSIAKK
jgi:Protein of unknown function (DUF2997)